MRIFEFFAYFVLVSSGSVVTADFGEFRVESSSTKVRDVLRVIGELSELEEFSQSLKTYLKNYDVRIKVTPDLTVLYNYFNVESHLNSMSFAFMVRSSVYVVRLLRDYCQLAIELINREFQGVSAEQKRESLRFRDRHDYCMLTAFHDHGLKMDSLKVRLLFESFLYFQTIDPHADAPLGDLHYQLLSFGQRYDSFLELKSADPRPRALEPPATSFQEYRDALTAIEEKIARFSHKFCSSWSPFVRSNILRTETPFDDLEDLSSPFVRRVFQYEICEVDFQRIQHVQNEVLRLYDPRVINQEENQQYRISRWNCDDDLTIAGQYRPPSNSMPAGNPFDENKKFSLDALRCGLKSNSYYLNVVKYYNIMADVLFLVSIDEGDKVLKGIELVVEKNCKKETDKLSVDKIRELRSTLSEFKSVFDELAFLIRDERRIIVTVNGQMKSFDGRVDWVMQKLDVQNDRMIDDDQIERICTELPKKLADIRSYTYLGDNQNSFEAFYFSESILNIRELYGFSLNGF